MTQADTQGSAYACSGSDDNLEPIFLVALQGMGFKPLLELYGSHKPVSVDIVDEQKYSGYYDGLSFIKREEMILEAYLGEKIRERGGSDDKGGLIGVL